MVVEIWCSSRCAPTETAVLGRPGVLVDQALTRSSLTSPSQSVSFLAATSPHSGDWLFALPIASCGLRLDDEAVRIGVGLRLGLPLYVPHQCRCGSQVHAHGLHSFVCKRAPGRSGRHHALNDLIARALASAGTPVTKAPQGLLRSDGKRPDGLTLIPYGKSSVVGCHGRLSASRVIRGGSSTECRRCSRYSSKSQVSEICRAG